MTDSTNGLTWTDPSLTQIPHVIIVHITRTSTLERICWQGHRNSCRVLSKTFWQKAAAEGYPSSHWLMSISLLVTCSRRSQLSQGHSQWRPCLPLHFLIYLDGGKKDKIALQHKIVQKHITPFKLLLLSLFFIRLRKLFMMFHKASRSLAKHFKHTSPTARSFSVLGLRRSLQEHSLMLLVASDWLVWTFARHWRHVTEQATNWPWHTLQHTIFIMPSCFYHWMLGMNVK